MASKEKIISIIEMVKITRVEMIIGMVIAEIIVEISFVGK